MGNSVTVRDTRRIYKITLSKIHKEFETIAEMGENRERETKYSSSDCLRCHLIIQGSDFISNNKILCSCKFVVPDGQMVLTEADLTKEPHGVADDTFFGVNAASLAVITALGSVIGTRINLINNSPVQIVIERNIDKPPPIKPSPHQCENRKITPPTKSVKKELKITTELEGKDDHVIIYASSGFGKTSFQNKLFSEGITIVDTDDIPAVEARHMRDLLKNSSVLTNRLDLLDPDLPTIAFVPKDPNVLQKKSNFPSLKESDFEYWYKLHEFPHHKRLVKCIVTASYLTHWFKEGEKVLRDNPINIKIRDGFLEKIKKLQ